MIILSVLLACILGTALSYVLVDETAKVRSYGNSDSVQSPEDKAVEIMEPAI